MNGSNEHYVTGKPLRPPFPDHLEQATFAMGCFWGAEKRFWEQTGVYSTAVGYTQGEVAAPSYEQVCSGTTGHAEAVLVVFDPGVIGYDALLEVFWEAHDPTQGMRQGNDLGSQYRSGIYTHGDDQLTRARASLASYQERLTDAGFPRITTEIQPAREFFHAEDYHQQYLAKNPGGYCGLGGTGVSCSV